MNRNPSRNKRQRIANRSGAAVVEFAVLMPVLAILVFGSIELANGIFMKQAVAESAYEGARAASRTAGTDSSVNSKVNEVLSARGIKSNTVTISPTLATVTRGTQITVTVSVPSSELGSVLPLQFLKNKTFSRSVTMVRL